MDFCLSIGLDKYIHLQPPTPYATNDAIGFDKIMRDVFFAEHSELLIDQKATYKNIEHHISKIVNKIGKGDRFIFFYAGHGENIKNNPYLSCHDSNNNVSNSWLNLMELIEKIIRKGCEKSIYFIDACESTIGFGERKVKSLFSIKKLKNNIKNSEYTSIFSSTSTKGEAQIMQEEKHGIWSYFLLEALSGKDKRAQNDFRTITNHTLVNYLNISVKEYTKLKKHTQIQTSFAWGKNEAEFEIITFPPQAIEVYKEVPVQVTKNVDFITLNYTNVRRLSGFDKRRGHSVPAWYNDTTNNFVKKISETELTEHHDQVVESLRKLLKLKSTDYQSGVDDGCAWFRSEFLNYDYFVELDEDDLERAIFTAKLVPKDMNMIVKVSKELDKCFPYWFDKLVYEFPQIYDIEKLIIAFENNLELLPDDLEFDYNQKKTKITLNTDNGRDITIEKNKIEIEFQTQETIPQMMNALKYISNQITSVAEGFLLLGEGKK